MANAKKTSSKAAQTTKTKPAKKPATKPAGASVKPKATKTVKVTKSATAQPSKKPETKGKKRHGGELVFGIIMVVLALAIVGGVITFFVCRNNSAIMLDAGNNVAIKSKFVSVPDTKAKLLIPADFKEIDHEEVEEMFDGMSDEAEVKNVYANKDRTAALAIISIDGALTDANLDTYISTMKMAANVSKAKDIVTDTFVNDDHKIATIKYLAPTSAAEDFPYQHQAIFSTDNKTILIQFCCTDGVKGDWATASNSIMHSVTFEK